MKFSFIVLIVSALSSILIINQVAETKGQYEKVLEKGREHRREEQAGAVNAGNSAIGWRRKRNIRGEEPADKTNNEHLTKDEEDGTPFPCSH